MGGLRPVWAVLISMSVCLGILGASLGLWLTSEESRQAPLCTGPPFFSTSVTGSAEFWHVCLKECFLESLPGCRHLERSGGMGGTGSYIMLFIQKYTRHLLKTILVRAIPGLHRRLASGEGRAPPPVLWITQGGVCTGASEIWY